MDGVGSLPAADAVLVGQLARRAGVLVAELGRARAAATGLLGSAAGWSGSAELAFQDSVAKRWAEFGPVLARLDGYAAALAGYARELERVEPGLRAARSRLDAAPGDPAAVAGYEACWRDWDAARRRCMARLQDASPVVRHRHGWSGWAHAVLGGLEHGVRLADCSRVLAEVGEGLMAAGLVCALVCPPLAGPIWAAVAVVAVCQLAVDAARRERGEPVGWGSLGWDMAAVVPAGRVVRRVHVAVEEIAECRTAAEADAAIRRLPKRLRSSPLVPGGGLQAHEGSATYRGHTIGKHVKKTPTELAQRLAMEPRVNVSSSFVDRARAEAAIARVLDGNRQAIASWLTDPELPLKLRGDFGEIVGVSVTRGGKAVTTSKLRVILKAEDSDLGFYIRTAYPSP
jgi:Bacterial CdiA-CT RNAse A domain